VLSHALEGILTGKRPAIDEVSVRLNIELDPGLTGMITDAAPAFAMILAATAVALGSRLAKVRLKQSASPVTSLKWLSCTEHTRSLLALNDHTVSRYHSIIPGKEDPDVWPLECTSVLALDAGLDRGPS
jgi:hypothetical protein